MKILKKIVIVLCIVFVLYFGGIILMNLLANNGYTNAESTIVEIPEEEIEKYELPEDVLNAQCVQFILNGIENRKVFNDTLKEYSDKLGVDYYIVISSILGEQLRISCKGYRGELKDIIVSGTPTLFRSYDISVGIAGLKLGTANKIKKDAIAYGYGDELKNVGFSEEVLSTNDELSAKLAVYLVKNIIHRRELSGYDISMDAGVVGTLYNMGNRDDKVPHDNPQIGGSIIDINGQKFTYGELSLGVYNYLTSLRESQSSDDISDDL